VHAYSTRCLKTGIELHRLLLADHLSALGSHERGVVGVIVAQDAHQAVALIAADVVVGEELHRDLSGVSLWCNAPG
jgi:hypothetical protein